VANDLTSNFAAQPDLPPVLPRRCQFGDERSTVQTRCAVSRSRRPIPVVCDAHLGLDQNTHAHGLPLLPCASVAPGLRGSGSHPSGEMRHDLSSVRQQADARSCGHCGAVTEQETPAEEAESVAVAVTENV
jgi:hypothetical protein